MTAERRFGQHVDSHNYKTSEVQDDYERELAAEINNWVSQNPDVFVEE